MNYEEVCTFNIIVRLWCKTWQEVKLDL